MEVNTSTKNEIRIWHSELRHSFDSGITLDVEFRKHELQKLTYLLQDNVELIAEAITKDLGRSRFESVFAEIMLTKNLAIEANTNVSTWSKSHSHWAGMVWALHSPTVHKEPKGTVLIIGAWNYPISVQIGPLIGALCAGCTVILKPSEIASHSAQLLAELWPKYMDPRMSRVITGGVEEATELLDLRWEHIFYTGNGRVGRSVAEKAARLLCPTTLELGGKSPVFIHESADLGIAAHRLMWAKSMNCGQTCIAPDYVLCTATVQDRLIEELRKVYAEFWPEGASQSNDYGRIINDRQFRRLENIVDNTKGSIVIGSKRDAKTRFLEPTVIKDTPPDDISMFDEIFGPILPIMTVEGMDEGCAFVNNRDQPLALYIFAEDRVSDCIIHKTKSGSVVQGDLMVQYAVSPLPFGGVGLSGYGAYHGKAGFETFSYTRSSLHAPATGILGRATEWLMASRYPPYSDLKLRRLTMLLGKNIPFQRPSRVYDTGRRK
jgi:acyl-CoA reductase-like NAD-dependent aldehyde dehydrogenase